MKIRILRRMEYENTFVYIMQFGYVFQYLFSWNKEIYQNHIIAKPSLWMRFLWFVKLVDVPYDKDTEDQLMEVILSGAMTSLDTLKKLEEDKRRDIVKHDRDGVPHVDGSKKIFAATGGNGASKPIPNEA